MTKLRGWDPIERWLTKEGVPVVVRQWLWHEGGDSDGSESSSTTRGFLDTYTQERRTREVSCPQERLRQNRGVHGGDLTGGKNSRRGDGQEARVGFLETRM
jgi:hypothetical protein